MIWQTVKLGDTCEVKRGTTITEKQAQAGDVPVVAGGLTHSYTHNAANREGNVITVSGSGANAGYVNFWKQPIFASDCSTIQSYSEAVDIRFVFYFLKSKQKFINSTLRSGAAQPHVYAKDIAQMMMPLPPLAQQHRIAAILDKAAEIKAKREQAIAKLDELAQSTFVEMFGDVQNKVALKSVCELITDGTHYTPTYADSGYVFLSAKNVTSGIIDWINVKYVGEELHGELQKRVSPKIGDVLLAKNGTTGVAAIVDVDAVFDIYVSLALLRPSKNILTTYLHAALNSVDVKRQFNSALKGVGVPNLHLVDIRNALIPLPTLDEQKAFDAKLNKLKEVRANVEMQWRNMAATIASLQHQAFTTGFNA